ncbi:MAG: hypothetical protein M0Z89_02380, partial [Nitrospiraceae bacterium]|nr:hypothetical protein [Nitrospiraceae bacterium]
GDLLGGNHPTLIWKALLFLNLSSYIIHRFSGPGQKALLGFEMKSSPCHGSGSRGNIILSCFFLLLTI